MNSTSDILQGKMNVFEKWLPFIFIFEGRQIDYEDAPVIAAWLQNGFTEERVGDLDMVLRIAAVSRRFLLLRSITEKCDFTEVGDCAKAGFLYIIVREFTNTFNIKGFDARLTEILPEPLKSNDVIQMALELAKTQESKEYLHAWLTTNREKL